MEQLFFDKGQYYAGGERYENFKNEVLYKIKANITFLENHNKNYTKEQYQKICEIYNFIKCLTID